MSALHNEREPGLYVLDTLANDLEDLESILRMLNSDTMLGWKWRWGRSFTRQEVVQALVQLIRADYVRVAAIAPDGTSLEPLAPRQLPAGSFDDVWFEMTPAGRLVHTNWDPELRDE